MEAFVTKFVHCVCRETNTVGSHFAMGLHSRIFGCKSHRLKTITI